MKTSRLFLCLFLLPVSLTLSAGEPLFSDPFTRADEVAERRAMRGDWTIADGVAMVTQDDALYKKFKDHGPIIFYDLPTENATFHYSVKPSGCRSVVFTLNASEGHVFRFVTGERGTNFRAFPPNSETKSIATHVEKEWILEENEWTDVTVKIQGKAATVSFGKHDPVTIEHDSYDRKKSNFSVGFSYGSLAVKDVRVTSE